MEDNRGIFIWLIGFILVITWVISLNGYNDAPARIPLHFDWDGTPNRWGEKTPFNFFLAPLISTALCALMIFLTRFPKLFNFPQKEQIKNWPDAAKKPVYDLLIKMMLVLAFIMSLMFLFIQVQVIESAKSHRLTGGDMWPMWILVAGILAVPIYYLVKISRLVNELQQKITVAGR